MLGISSPEEAEIQLIALFRFPEPALLSRSDGVDVMHRRAIGRFSHTLLAHFGESRATLANGSSVHLDKTMHLSDSVGFGDTTIRASYQRADVSLTAFHPLFDAFRQLGPEGVALANRFDADDTLFHFFSVGATYDPGDWFVMGEAGQVSSHSALGTRTSWYVSGGYRWKAITPFLTYARTTSNSTHADPGLTVSNYPVELATTVTALNATLNGVLASNPEQQTLSIGARWDFRENAALKLQFNHSDLAPGSAGVLTNLQPGFERGGDFDLLSVSIDFVF